MQPTSHILPWFTTQLPPYFHPVYPVLAYGRAFFPRSSSLLPSITSSLLRRSPNKIAPRPCHPPQHSFSYSHPTFSWRSSLRASVLGQVLAWSLCCHNFDVCFGQRLLGRTAHSLFDLWQDASLSISSLRFSFNPFAEFLVAVQRQLHLYNFNYTVVAQLLT